MLYYINEKKLRRQKAANENKIYIKCEESVSSILFSDREEEPLAESSTRFRQNYIICEFPTGAAFLNRDT